MVVITESLQTICRLVENEKLFKLCETLSEMKQKITVVIENKNNITHDIKLVKWHNPRRDFTMADKSKVVNVINGRKVYARKKKYPNAIDGLELFNKLGTLEMLFDVKFEFVAKTE